MKDLDTELLKIPYEITDINKIRDLEEKTKNLLQNILNNNDNKKIIEDTIKEIYQIKNEPEINHFNFFIIYESENNKKISKFIEDKIVFPIVYKDFYGALGINYLDILGEKIKKIENIKAIIRIKGYDYKYEIIGSRGRNDPFLSSVDNILLRGKIPEAIILVDESPLAYEGLIKAKITETRAYDSINDIFNNFNKLYESKPGIITLPTTLISVILNREFNENKFEYPNPILRSSLPYDPIQPYVYRLDNNIYLGYVRKIKYKYFKAPNTSQLLLQRIVGKTGISAILFGYDDNPSRLDFDKDFKIYVEIPKKEFIERILYILLPVYSIFSHIGMLPTDFSLYQIAYSEKTISTIKKLTFIDFGSGIDLLIYNKNKNRTLNAIISYLIGDNIDSMLNQIVGDFEKIALFKKCNIKDDYIYCNSDLRDNHYEIKEFISKEIKNYKDLMMKTIKESYNIDIIESMTNIAKNLLEIYKETLYKNKFIKHE